MISMNIGKLYVCQKYYLLVYSTIDIFDALDMKTVGWKVPPAVASGAHAPGALGHANDTVKSWSERLHCNVTFSNPYEIFMIADQKNINDQTYIKILCKEKLGWIIWKDWLEIYEVSNSEYKNWNTVSL